MIDRFGWQNAGLGDFHVYSHDWKISWGSIFIAKIGWGGTRLGTLCSSNAATSESHTPPPLKKKICTSSGVITVCSSIFELHWTLLQDWSMVCMLILDVAVSIKCFYCNSIMLKNISFPMILTWWEPIEKATKNTIYSNVTDVTSHHTRASCGANTRREPVNCSRAQPLSLTLSLRPKTVTWPLACSLRCLHSTRLRPLSMGRVTFLFPTVGLTVPASRCGSVCSVTSMPLASMSRREPSAPM